MARNRSEIEHITLEFILLAAIACFGILD